MLAHVQKQIEQDGLLAPGETVVVGVSGGVDSTALLHILNTLNRSRSCGWTIHAVHVNHGFRGEEARQDAAYVRELCASLGVFCHVFERDVPAYMKETGMGAQEAGREVRYRLFREVAEQVGASKVAVAHHADDQAETIMLRLLRGTGLRGLAGIPVRRWLVEGKVEVVRPLLSVTKQELADYCRTAGLTPREDASNRSRAYARNRLRLDVLPLFDSINPRWREHLLELARIADIEDRYLDQLARERLEACVTARDEGRVVLDRKTFQTCDLALQRRMIPLILSYLSSGQPWSSQHVEAVLHIIRGERPSAVAHLPANIAVKRVYGNVHVERQTETNGEDISYQYLANVPGTTWIAECGIAVHTSWLKSAPDWRQLSNREAVFDADLLPGGLIVRNRRQGDRITLAGGTKKLKELMIDAKVPLAWRNKWPLVTAGGKILWVPGVKRSVHAPVSERTTSFLHVEVEFGEEWREVFS